jgi:hypothetical protein
MSALGQKATSTCYRTTSVFPPTTDFNSQERKVRFGPEADIDHLIGARAGSDIRKAMGVIEQSVLLIQIKTAATDRPLRCWLGSAARHLPKDVGKTADSGRIT